MAFDMKAICDAIASRFAAGTIPTPTGATAMRASYGQAPHSMPNTPAVVVMPQDGTIVVESGVYRTENKIDILFYHSKKQGDVPRSELQRQLWLPALITATLGTPATWSLSGLVKSVLPVEWEFLELPYGADMYDGIRIGADVIVRDIAMPS